MTSSFLLQLDTQVGLAIQLNEGAVITATEIVALSIATDEDVAEVKVWGDIEPTSPLNGLFGQTKAEAPWIPVQALLEVELRHGVGPRQIGVEARDDVLNVAEAFAEIGLGEALPPPPPVPAPPRRTQPPLPAEPERRTVRSRSRAQVCDRNRVITVIPSQARTRMGAGWKADSGIGSSTAIRTSDRVGANAQLGCSDEVHLRPRHDIRKTPVGPEMTAILELLGLL